MKKKNFMFLVIMLMLLSAGFLLPSKAYAAITVKPTASVTVSNKSGYEYITWKKVKGVTGYLVYKKTGSGSYKLLKTIKSGSTVKLKDTKVKNGTAYTYKIVSYKKVKAKTYKSKGKISAKKIYISPVTSLTTQNYDGFAEISWGKNTKAKSYKVYRNSVLVGTVKNAYYYDKTAAKGKTYTYKIYAVASDGKSESYPVSVKMTRLVSPIVDVTGSDSGVTVSWKAVSGATVYKLRKQDVDGNYTQIYAGSNTSFTDTNVVYGKTYTYMLYAGNSISHASETIGTITTDHDYVLTDKTAASCTDDGNEKYVCAGCGEAFEKTADAFGHDYKETTVIAPSCAESGLLSYECSRCHDTYEETADKLPHSPEKRYTAGPTCDGYVYEEYCTVCKEVLDTVTEDKVKEHDGEWIVIKDAATCQDEGFKRLVCKNTFDGIRCDKVLEETSFTGEHEYEKVSETASTCDQHGKAVYKCIYCEESYTKELPFADHTPGDKQLVKAPTCGKQGTNETHCIVCNVLIDTESIPATGKHSAGEWITEKEPTCTEEGVKAKYCSECGSKVQEELIPAKGHMIVKNIPKHFDEYTESEETYCYYIACGDAIDSPMCGRFWYLEEFEVNGLDLDDLNMVDKLHHSYFARNWQFGYDVHRIHHDEQTRLVTGCTRCDYVEEIGERVWKEGEKERYIYQQAGFKRSADGTISLYDIKDLSHCYIAGNYFDEYGIYHIDEDLKGYKEPVGDVPDSTIEAYQFSNCYGYLSLHTKQMTDYIIRHPELAKDIAAIYTKNAQIEPGLTRTQHLRNYLESNPSEAERLETFFTEHPEAGSYLSFLLP